jgi:peptidoglycan/xylan/chitin deacetylase (PgdA/CDA1 family)
VAEQDNTQTRRRLLQLGVLAGAAAALAIPIEAMTGFGSTAQANAHRVPLAPHASRTLVTTTLAHPASATTTRHALQDHPTAPRPALGPPEPAWLHTWNDPVSRLDDFMARSPHTYFPRNSIMLTIDDGPHPVWTPKYLQLLARHHVQATFSVIGEQVLEYPQLVKAAVHDGHHIANHTFAHPLNLPQLNAARIRRELEDTNDAIVRTTGFRPRQFRAPGGVWGPDVYSEVSRQQMMPLGWDIDPRDWSLPGITHIRSAMLAARPHDIILCHDGGGDRSQTYAALEKVIPALLHRGWNFVTLPSPQPL